MKYKTLLCPIFSLAFLQLPNENLYLVPRGVNCLHKNGPNPLWLAHVMI